MTTDFDAIVVGSGPNGLAAAITLQQQGLSVWLVEGAGTVGGGMRTAELTLPGFHHDICSAVHPMAVGSPFFRSLPLNRFGLEFAYPEIQLAHPFDDGDAAVLLRSVTETAGLLGTDEDVYNQIFGKLVSQWASLSPALLAPLHFPRAWMAYAGFGIKGLQPATVFSKKFATEKAKGLFAGMAAHAMQPLSNCGTAAFGLVLATVGHAHGWPVAKGGSRSIAQALANYFLSLGGKIETGVYVKNLQQLPSAKAVLFDVTPRQLLQIAGHRFSSWYRWQLNRYRYGMGIFKIDFALDGPVPFSNEACKRSGTVHLGNTLQEMAANEAAVARGRLPENPFVLLAQPSLIDPGRAPEGKQAVWAYCHVPHGSVADMTSRIENQVERFAPGFKERILTKHVLNTAALEAYNPNYIGGDINGGAADIRQLFTRPALRWSPYRTSAKGLYICSSSTPPGGGVHGMCGYHAAQTVLKDIF